LCGNGLIDLSARANVQLRGVTEGSFPALIDGLRGLGLIDATPEAEARRNIIVWPFWIDGDGTQQLAHLLEAALVAPDAPNLPGKFGFAVDGGTGAIAHDTPADVRLERHAQGWLVRADSFATGAVADSPEAAVDAAIGLARWFLDTGGAPQGRGRMAGLWGDQPQPVRHARLPQRFREVVKTPMPASRPVPGDTAAGRLVGLEFGQVTAETLLGLSDLGAVRVTPWRMLLIEGLNTAPDLPGLITSAHDPMLRVVACTGAPGCLQAHQPTRALARALAPHVTETLHVSGCAKGCAQPGVAPVTLVGTPHGFDLILNGQTTDPATTQALTDPTTIAQTIKALR
ncbi:MAG: precorrin-3B synthase, partial [Paracoccaceae bacterium]